MNDKYSLLGVRWWALDGSERRQYGLMARLAYDYELDEDELVRKYSDEMKEMGMEVVEGSFVFNLRRSDDAVNGITLDEELRLIEAWQEKEAREEQELPH